MEVREENPSAARALKTHAERAGTDGRDLPLEEWNRLLARDRDEIAIAETDREVTVGELVTLSRERAAQFIDHGVSAGSRVIVARPNSVEFVVDYLAIRLCGAILVNLPWSAAKNIVELAEVTDAVCVVLAENLVGENPVFNELGERRFRENVKSSSVGPEAPPPRLASELGWMACTSGTTGSPKAAMHSYASFERQVEVFVERFDLTGDDPILVSSPVGHAVALLFGVRMALMTNALMVIVPRWRIDAAVDLIEKYQCVFTVAPTPFLVDMVDYATAHGTKRIESLLHFPSSGAPVPGRLKKRAFDVMPHCEVWAYFGTSEAGAVTAVAKDASLDQQLNTDGIALSRTRTRVVDGELEIHNPEQMMTGYWTGDHDGRLGEDGWYKTGDAAFERPDGYIQMVGRARDIILRGGENISPLEIENVLLGHDAVTDVAIIGYPDDRLGARLAAVVVAKQPVTLDDLCAYCDDAGLEKAKWPEFVDYIDEIPLSAIGKVRREVLEEYVLNKMNDQSVV